MRNMSFALTTEQARNKTKTVTRRMGWWNLKPGELVQQVVKSQGLKKGEHIEKIHVIRILKTGVEPINRLIHEPEYGQSEIIKEGFPSWSPLEFVLFFCSTHNCEGDAKPNRIEFEYVEAEKGEGRE